LNELGIHLTILVATASICCRAGLNVIDRYYFRRHRGTVVAAGIINDGLPVGILFAPFVVAVGATRLATQIASWRAIVLAIIVQAVAYVFRRPAGEILPGDLLIIRVIHSLDHTAYIRKDVA